MFDPEYVLAGCYFWVLSYTTRNRKAWSVNEFLAGLLIGWLTAGPIVLAVLAFARAGDDD